MNGERRLSNEVEKWEEVIGGLEKWKRDARREREREREDINFTNISTYTYDILSYVTTLTVTKPLVFRVGLSVGRVCSAC